MEHLSRAVNAFRELGAKLEQKRAEAALANLDRTAPERNEEQSALPQLLTLRLAEAVTSRELLLRELAAIMRQETNAKAVIITEPGEHNRRRVVIAHGCTPAESAQIAEQLDQLVDEESQAAYAKKKDATILQLRSSHAPPATLYISPSSRANLPGGLSLEPLMRVAELGMDVCALRAGSQKGSRVQQPAELTGTSLMPGFIHSSPAMTKLVEEVHKIRSSDVTVLVTGESGTGKELVARAIHALVESSFESFCSVQLHRRSQRAFGRLSVWLSSRRLYRRGDRFGRRYSHRRRRNSLPRRNWRSAARSATKAAALSAGR